jgi:predicted DNA-binding transcriptional regulator AlpA
MHQAKDSPTPASTNARGQRKRKDPAAALSNFDNLPDSATVRLPVVAGWLGVSPATVWRYARAGLIPKPNPIGLNTTGWNVGELRRSRARG